MTTEIERLLFSLNLPIMASSVRKTIGSVWNGFLARGEEVKTVRRVSLDSEYGAEILRTLLDKGFQLPIYWVAVGINGSILAAQYEASGDKDLTCNFLIEHCPSGTVQFPINMMFVDSQGQAARVLIKGPDKVEYLN